MSFVEYFKNYFVFCGRKVKVSIFVEQILNSIVAIILDGGSIKPPKSEGVLNKEKIYKGYSTYWRTLVTGRC